MFRNYLTAALRNLAHNRLYAAINLLGLVIGFVAVILVGLFVSDEFSYENFIPNYKRTYLITERLSTAGAKPLVIANSPAELAGWMKQDFPSLEAVTRLELERTSLRYRDIEDNEQVYWADPNFFDVIALPAIAGDPKTSLQRPDSVVLTKTIALKYFGRDDVVGETLEIGRKHAMRITAVLRDLPSNTHLDTQIFASGIAAFSPLTEADAKPAPLSRGYNTAKSKTYARLRADASVVDLQNALKNIIATRVRANIFNVDFPVYPIAEIHLHSEASMDQTRPSGSLSTIYAVSAIGVLTLFLAGVNFVNLMTARAARRAMEVGIRRSLGATRRHLALQFVGEAAVYAALAMLLSLALVELLLPAFNAFLDRTIFFNYWREPAIAAVLLALTLTTGGLAGIYPAFILSAFAPKNVFSKSGHASGSGRVRQLLVSCQFAILIALMLAAGVIYKQMLYATKQGLRLQTDQVLGVETDCRKALKEAVSALPGVSHAACSFSAPTVPSYIQGDATFSNGHRITFAVVTFVDADFFALFDIKPLAGRILSETYSVGVSKTDSSAGTIPVVVNKTFVEKLGATSAETAIGQVFSYPQLGPAPRMIAGVIPDYPEDTVRETIRPTLYSFDSTRFRLLAVKLRGRDIPETLQAIDKLWSQLGDPRPINRVFLNERTQQLYLDITRQTQLITAFAAVAACIACLGLFGLSAFMAERRTKEIGIRKAMGATTGELMHQLLWQFTRPVLWASLIAWPLAGYFMSSWLAGFAYHIDLEPWLFLAATAAALLVALLTVSTHCYLVARAKPVHALRYE